MFSPFGNQTTNTTAAWHPEPRGRGTFNVLSSCLTTMILCVWTALHLNIPGYNESRKQRVLRKLGWLLLALLAPEIVAWNAWEQRGVAQGLTSAFRRAFEPEQAASPGWLRRARLYLSHPMKSCPDSEQGSSLSSRSRVTLVHGFYAAMGGYVIHFTDTQHSITGHRRLTLTKDGIQWLLKCAPEIFPDLDEAEILDKSKASTLVKTLTCLQALWFCLQCIVRLTMNTSISLLELNVLGHCTCTFIIYAIWWHKPLDVSEPTLLKIENGPELEGLLAVLNSYTSRTVPRLPHPFAKCAETGHKYSIWTEPLEDGQSHDPPRRYPLWYLRLTTPHRFQDGLHRRRTYTHDLETQFSADGSPHRCVNTRTLRGLGFHVDDNEKRVDKCAGLHLEKLKQLLNIDASLPQMQAHKSSYNMHADHICSKIWMYEDIAKYKVRLTVGTEQIGLTYYLSRDKLERLEPKEDFEQLETTGLISGEPKTASEESYYLGRSFLMWLDFESRDFGYVNSNPWVRRPPRPFLGRTHDWTFRLNPKRSIKSDLWPLNLVAFFSHVEDFFFAWVVCRGPEWLAMSAAASVYGGLHLLAWNAPFHAPIYGLLWRISGITTASLSTFPLLILLYLVTFNRALRIPNYKRFILYSKRYIFLILVVANLTLFGIISFIPLYVFARVYLVVESFLSLAYLPDSVLVTPNFSLYFPHIQ